MQRQSVRPVLYGLAAFMVSGCATVQMDAPADTALPPAYDTATASGLTYYLPRRLLTIEVTVEPKKKAELLKSLKAADEKLAKAKEERDAAKSAKEGASKLAAELQKLCGKSCTGGLQAALAEAQKALAVATADDTLKEDAFQSASNAQHQAENIWASALAGNDCTYSTTIKSGDIVADTRRPFRLQPSHNWLRDDTTKFEVNSQGLLSTANVTATDRTGDILAEFAGAISAGGGRGAGKVNFADYQMSSATCNDPAFKMQFDPMYANVAGSPDNINKQLEDRGLPFNVDVAGVAQNPNDAPASGKTGISGILYRTEVPVLVTLSQQKDATRSNGFTPISGAFIPLPQAGPVAMIPMKSSAFVKTVNDVEFSNGMVKSWSADRPSEVMEVVRLPVKILKAIFSIPTDLISFKVDYSTKDASLAEQQALALSYQQKRENLELCIALAGEDLEKLQACLD